jgi:serine/threonine protein phosphatase PrpC
METEEIFNTINQLESKLQKIEIEYDQKLILLTDTISKFRYNCKCIEDLIEYIEKSFNHKLKTLESKCDKLIDIQNKKIILKNNKLNEVILKNKLDIISNSRQFEDQVIKVYYSFFIFLFIGVINAIW